MKFIASMAYLGSWAFIPFIIVVKFLLNHCPFLLEAIGANDFDSFSLQTHLKLT
jgi:hypothetical protein